MKDEEFYINSEVKQIIDRSPEAYKLNHTLVYDSEHCPDLFFCTQSIEQYDKLFFYLSHSERLNEFAVNAFYYFGIQADYYEATGLHRPNAEELARADVIDLYNAYNQKEITA